MKKITYLLICVMLLCTAACTQNENQADVWENAAYTDSANLGVGQKMIAIEVTAEEKTVEFSVYTDCDTLGEALEAVQLIEGHDGAYGLYVDSVNGIAADYEKDGSYWAITKAGEYMTTGVDGVSISDGDRYEFTYTKM